LSTEGGDISTTKKEKNKMSVQDIDIDMEPWSPEICVVEPEAQSLSRLGAPTKMLFLAKWSPGVKKWSPKAPNIPPWSSGALHISGRSPGALKPFGTLSFTSV